MSTVLIGRAAALYGLAPSTLRWWERQGIVGEPRRDGARRRYGERDLRRIGVAYLCHVTGMMSLAKTAVVSSGAVEAPAWRRVVREEVDALGDRIERMSAARDYLRHLLHCTEDDMVGCPYLDGELMHHTPRGRTGEPDILRAARTTRP